MGLISLCELGAMAQPNPVFPKVKAIYDALMSGKTSKLSPITQDAYMTHVHSYSILTSQTNGGQTHSISLIVSIDDSLKMLYINVQKIGKNISREQEDDEEGFAFKPNGMLVEAGTSGTDKVYDEIDFSKKDFDQTLYKKYLPDITFSIDEIYNRISK